MYNQQMLELIGIGSVFAGGFDATATSRSGVQVWVTWGRTVDNED